MIEVFKTNVEDRATADFVIALIHKKFSCYNANFDLHDCDKILRIKTNEHVDALEIVELLKWHNIEACVLPDEIVSASRTINNAVYTNEHAIGAREMKSAIEKKLIDLSFPMMEKVKMN